MTKKIHKKLSKFGSKAPIVEKALSSFDHFYKAANKLDDDLIQKHGSKVAAQVKFISKHSSFYLNTFHYISRLMLQRILTNLY
jgi:hypothetical protein